MDDLVAVTTPRRAAQEGAFVLDVAEGWGQGRGTFGGLVLGALTRAMIECEPDAERALRAMSGEIAGPVVAGPATITVEAVRRGSAVSTWNALLSQNGEHAARASAVLGRARASDHRWSPPPPRMRPWRELALAPVGVGPWPEFTQFFDYWPSGPLPFTGGSDPAAEGWVRTKKIPRALGAVEAVALIDAYWPAAFAVETAPRPVGTVAFAFHYFPPRAPLDPAEPLYYRARAVAAQAGYIIEHRELWTAAGELLALNPQTFVWIR